MDTYNKINNQTKCNSFDSVDISYYLYNKIIEKIKKIK